MTIVCYNFALLGNPTLVGRSYTLPLFFRFYRTSNRPDRVTTFS